MKKTNIPWLLILVLTASLLLNGCTASAVISPHPETAVAGPAVISDTLHFTASLVPEKSVSLTAQAGGIIASVSMAEGQAVKKGDLLLTLDDEELTLRLNQAQTEVQRGQIALTQARINLSDAQKNWERQKALYEAGGISQSVWESAVSARDLAQAAYDTANNITIPTAANNLKQAQINLDKSQLKAPWDGLIVSCNGIPGQNVTASAVVATLIAPQSMHLTVPLPEAYLNLVQEGQEVQISIPSLNHQLFSGTVSYLNPVSLAAGQTFPLQISLANPELILKAGMTAEILLTCETTADITVPVSALSRSNNKDYVYVLQDGYAVQTPVLLGLSDGERTAIIEGLASDAEVACSDVNLLRDGIFCGEPTP